MIKKIYIKHNTYQDSVALMRLSGAAAKMDGVNRASVMMGTPLNKTVLEEVGLDTPEIYEAQPSDLMIVVEAGEEAAADAAIESIKSELNKEAELESAEETDSISSVDELLIKDAGYNIIAISVPGAFAAAEARKALRNGLNVFLFSDNVSEDDELELKRYAHERGLLVMGPDCGTSFLNGVPLGFVNNVRRGNIGIVGASGTGIQEVMCRIHQLGGGVSHAIGTGSRDLSAKIGGISMLDGLKLLARDRQTEVIVLISKPPEPGVAKRICEEACKCGVPVVACFIGAPPMGGEYGNLHTADTLENAARMALALAMKKEYSPPAYAQAETAFPEGAYLRGLYSGGTLAYEAMSICRKHGMKVYSNTPLDKPLLLESRLESRENTIIDMGDDKFTQGKPHPMIDYTDRLERLKKEASDMAVKVILMDVITGYGSNLDPIGDMAPVIGSIKRRRPGLEIVVHICGTGNDAQSTNDIAEKLGDMGVRAEFNHEAAVELACRLLGGCSAGGGAA